MTRPVKSLTFSLLSHAPTDWLNSVIDWLIYWLIDWLIYKSPHSATNCLSNEADRLDWLRKREVEVIWWPQHGIKFLVNEIAKMLNLLRDHWELFVRNYERSNSHHKNFLSLNPFKRIASCLIYITSPGSTVHVCHNERWWHCFLFWVLYGPAQWISKDPPFHLWNLRSTRWTIWRLNR